MPNKPKALIAIAAIMVAVALAAWSHRTRAPVQPTAPAVGSAAEAQATSTRSARAAKPPPRTVERSRSEPSDDRPFAEIRPELERRALAGDAAAARRLGMTLTNCNHYVEMPQEQFENLLVEEEAKGNVIRDRGRIVPPDRCWGGSGR